VSKVSNAYLSQVERGLHEPSLRVLAAVANALSVTVEDLLAGARPPGPAVSGGDGVEAAILAETRLTGEQKNALIAVYRNFLGE
jgi:transcriptional regulator with XRE-family HTH domain